MNPAVRDQFPLLKRKFDGQLVTYLDSAATSLKPQSVIDIERLYEETVGANIHRGKHALSEEASYLYENARKQVGLFLGAEPSNIVFVRGTTEALNMVAAGLGLSKSDSVLTLRSEHHSNLVPWMSRATVDCLANDPCVPFSAAELKAALEKKKYRVFTVAHGSNVTGVVNPIADLCRIAREAGVISVVDAAQTAPHVPIDVNEWGCDFLCLSGHKMLGPTGVGVLYGRTERLEALEPAQLGGGTVDLVTTAGFTLKGVPARLEAGTPNISGVIGLGAAAAWLTDLGLDEVGRYDAQLTAALREGVAGLPKCEVLMARRDPCLAIATIVPRGMAADHVARILSEGPKIMVRSGFFCAHPLFDALGLPAGLRISAYLYNRAEEVTACCVAVRRAVEQLSVG